VVMTAVRIVALTGVAIALARPTG